jgi:hypothetical protein
MKRAGKLVRDRRRAQLGTGIAAQSGMHDRTVGQLRARQMVVGHDHVQAQATCKRNLVDRADSAVGRDQK